MFKVGDRVRVKPEALQESGCEFADRIADGGYIIEFDEGDAFVAPNPGETEGTYLPTSALLPYDESARD